MTSSRDHQWSSVTGLAGGLAMFVGEAVVVLGLAGVAWLVSVTILSIL